MQTILLVDDEQRMLDLVELFLSPHGYKCIKETNGIEALQTLKKEQVDLVLLDVMMPGMDGWEVCEAIREFSSIPIIMLTARMEKGDLVKGLNIGADDYITKPFDERELIARVNALLRRTVDTNNTIITFKDFILDTEMFSLQYKNQTIQLTMKEFYIIKALISRPNKAYTREELLNVAWEYEPDIDIRAVDSHIRNLRDKLRKADFPTDEFLNTVWGIGYRWN